MTTRLDLELPKQFHYAHTVMSHGWCDLAPFSLERETAVLSRPLRMGNGGTTNVSLIRESGDGATAVLAHTGRLSATARDDVRRRLRDMLFADLDLAPFYARIRPHPEYRWMARRRAGRFLRGETLFEDAVKMILTTNCSWGLTKSMNARLIALFGEPDGRGGHLFPTPASIAGATEKILRERAKLGYRAPFVLELARRVARGAFDIESLRTATLPAAELYEALRAIPGIGPYAAGNLLKLLGRYEYLGLDSWCRGKFSELHAKGAPADDRSIERHYAPFEEWKGLVLWLDLSREWYFEKFPL